MYLSELGKLLEKDKRAYKNPLKIKYDGFEYYISEFIIDNKKIYFFCSNEWDSKMIAPCDIVRLYKKKYYNDCECLIVSTDDEFVRDIKSLGFVQGNGNFGELDYKIIYI